MLNRTFKSILKYTIYSDNVKMKSEKTPDVVDGLCGLKELEIFVLRNIFIDGSLHPMLSLLFNVNPLNQSSGRLFQ